MTLFTKTNVEYFLLHSIKNSLGIKKNNEVSKSLILDKVKYKNILDLYTIQYLVDNITYAPLIIKKQNDILIKNIKNTKALKKAYKQTQELYENNAEFIKYKKAISRELCLSRQENRYIVNRIIYEFAYKYINKDIYLSRTNIFLNLFLLQKWLKEHEEIKILQLSLTDEFILFSMLNGMMLEDFINFYDINKAEDCEALKYKIETVIPAKLQVATTNQALIKYYYLKILKKGTR